MGNQVENMNNLNLNYGLQWSFVLRLSKIKDVFFKLKKTAKKKMLVLYFADIVNYLQLIFFLNLPPTMMIRITILICKITISKKLISCNNFLTVSFEWEKNIPKVRSLIRKKDKILILVFFLGNGFLLLSYFSVKIKMKNEKRSFILTRCNHGVKSRLTWKKHWQDLVFSMCVCVCVCHHPLRKNIEFFISEQDLWMIIFFVEMEKYKQKTKAS